MKTVHTSIVLNDGQFFKKLILVNQMVCYNKRSKISSYGINFSQLSRSQVKGQDDPVIDDFILFDRN